MSMEKTSKESDKEVCLKKGNEYYFGKNVSKDLSAAASYYKRAAELGSAMAKARLGEMYYKGYGVGINLGIAKKYLKEAADMKCTYALYVLGSMCYAGDYGFLAGKGKAFEFWKRAAKLGHPASQYMIACSYMGDEWGEEMSYKKAAYWFMCAYQNREAGKEVIDKAKIYLNKLSNQVNLDSVKSEIINVHPEYLNL